MLEAGNKAPQFTLKDGTEAPWTLPEALARGPVLLVFYKISCPVCQMSLPFLDRIAGSDSIQVVAISQDEERVTERFQQTFGGRMKTLFDREENEYPVSNAFGIAHVPSLFLVEPDGIISKAFAGFSRRDFEAIAQRAAVPLFHPEEKLPEWKAG